MHLNIIACKKKKKLSELHPSSTGPTINEAILRTKVKNLSQQCIDPFKHTLKLRMRFNKNKNKNYPILQSR